MGLKRIVRVAGINLVLLGAGLAILELSFGGWLDGSDPLLGFTKPRDVQWSFAAPWAPGGTVYTRDSNGLRGVDGPLDAVFILTMGGSTTDQRYLSDDATWQEVLQGRIEANGEVADIVNAGIDGQSSVGHIKNFAQWLNRIDTLKPRYILFYVGINDFFLPDTNAFDRDLAETGTERLIRERSALVAMGRMLESLVEGSADETGAQRRAGHAFGGIHTAGYVDQRVFDRCCDQPALSDAFKALGQRIRQLADLSRKFGAEPIFVTQRSALWMRGGDGIVGAPALQYASPSILAALGAMTGVDRHDVERAQSDVIMEACAMAKATCLNLFAEVAFDLETDFYDAFHNTPAGAQAVATYLFGALQEKGVLKTVADGSNQ
ncbi:MAG: SGNH/GDSL hydrolase family protein [Pseudomonadota bacterium]